MGRRPDQQVGPVRPRQVDAGVDRADPLEVLESELHAVLGDLTPGGALPPRAVDGEAVELGDAPSLPDPAPSG